MVKTFSKNENNKIEFSENELKKLLDEIFFEGYQIGLNKRYTYTTPIWTYTNTYPYSTISNSDSITWSTTDVMINNSIDTSSTVKEKTQNETD